jgi:glycosyltransferase involved in cell wall biosynthesis
MGSKNPLKLVVLLQDLEFGGTQRYTVHLLKHIDRELFSPELWVLRGGADMWPAARDAGIPIRALSSSSWVTPWALIRFTWNVFFEQPDILYTLTAVPNIWGRVVGTVVRVPVIVSGYRSLYTQQHERWLWHLSDRIICNAHALKDVMTGRFHVAPDRIAVIPNAVDTTYFHPEPEPEPSPRTILFVGRLVDDKDPLNLLEAFNIAAKRVPDARLEMVGNGPLISALQERVHEYDLASRVELSPPSTDVRPAMRRASVFVLASAQEASPNVIMEAMAMGLPVVATRVGGIPELVEDGKTGILVEPGDPQGLADALTTLLEDEGLRREMGLLGRQRVETFHSLQHMVSETERVLLEAAAGKTGPNLLRRLTIHNRTS